MSDAKQIGAHLLPAYSTVRQPQTPLVQPLQSHCLCSGPTSFNSESHGACASYRSFTDSESSSLDLSESTAARIATLQSKLNKKLGPEYISQRPGPGGGQKLTYAEGWKIIGLANEVFGFNGWSSSIVNMTTDFVDFNEESRRYNVGVSTIVRVTLRDGVFHEDVGYGVLENSKSKGAALDKCKKEAVTDAVKRALRNFGNLLGNCLYDKQYTQEVIKIKVNPTKLDKDSLHRHPQYDDSKPASTLAMHTTGSSSYQQQQQHASESNSASFTSPHTVDSIKRELTFAPLPAFPPHMRLNTTCTPSGKGVPPAQLERGFCSGLGLTTPIQTPNQHTASIAPKLQNSVDTIKLSIKAEQPKNNVAPNACQAPVPFDDDPSAAIPKPRQDPKGEECPPSLGAKGQKEPGSVTVDANRDMQDQDTDSFMLTSDDDALFANIDLSEFEADMGRPLENEEGIGGAIDFDEGRGRNIIGESVQQSIGSPASDCVGAHNQQQPEQKLQEDAQATEQRRQRSDNITPRRVRFGEPTKIAAVNEGHGQGQGRDRKTARSSGLASAILAGLVGSDLTSTGQQMRQTGAISANSSSLSSHPKFDHSSENTTKNGSINQNLSSLNTPIPTRIMGVSVPPAGRSDFPPGMQSPMNKFSINRAPGVNRISTANVGVKRNFDAVNSSGSRLGMGLAHSAANTVAGKENEVRQPFSHTDNEGGYSKRVRR